MKDLISLPKRVPQVLKVTVNQGRGIYGSFIDPEWVWHYVQAGEWEFQLESKSYKVGPGDMVLLPPRLLHIVQPIRGHRLVQWVVHFEWAEGPFHSGKVPFVVETEKSVRPRINAWFGVLQEEWRERRSQYQVVAGGLVSALLGLHFRHAKMRKMGVPQKGGSWGSIEETISYIQEHHDHRDLRLPEIGRAIRLSPNYLCRIFKRSLGLSVMEYLAIYRVQRAEELLIGSMLNCSEIAEEVGFESVHRLSRIFRKFKGMPPTAYRRDLEV